MVVVNPTHVPVFISYEPKECPLSKLCSKKDLSQKP